MITCCLLFHYVALYSTLVFPSLLLALSVWGGFSLYLIGLLPLSLVRKCLIICFYGDLTVENSTTVLWILSRLSDISWGIKSPILPLLDRLCCFILIPEIMSYGLKTLFSFLCCWLKSRLIHKFTSLPFVLCLPRLSLVGDLWGPKQKKNRKFPAHLSCVWCLFCAWILYVTWLYLPSNSPLEKPYDHGKYCCHDGASMPPPVPNFRMPISAMMTLGRADMRSVPSYCPLGRTVINLWLKDLRML